MDDLFDPEPSLPLNDESVLPRLAFANHDKVEDEVEDNYQQWYQYRSGGGRITATPTTTNEDEENDDSGENVAVVSSQGPSKNTNMSIMSRLMETVDISGGPSGGFSTQQYEELVKLRNENFGLKLRVRLLEESQGLVLRPGDKENVLRLNLDLRVETETLKQQSDEKDRLFKDTLDSLEKERDEERQLFRDRIQDLEANNRELYEENLDLKSARKEDCEEGEETEAQNILLEGLSLTQSDLDAHPDNDEQEEEEVVNEDTSDLPGKIHGELDELSKELHHIASLEKELAIEQDHCRDLQATVDSHTADIEDLVHENADLIKDVGKLNKHLEEKEQFVQELKTQNVALQGQLEMDQQSVTSLQQRNDNALVQVQNELQTAQQVNVEVTSDIEGLKIEMADEQKRYKETLEQHKAKSDEEVSELTETIERLEKDLDEEKKTVDDQQVYLNVKLTEIANLHKQVDELRETGEAQKKELVESEENKTKFLLCINGLTEINMEQKKELESLEKQVRKKTHINERLTQEYEKLKAKVRKYRSAKDVVEHAVVESNIDDSKLVSDLDEAKTREALLRAELDKLKEIKPVHEEVACKDKEIALLRNELMECKRTFTRCGADRALAEAKKVYEAQMVQLDRNHSNVVVLLTKRLEELASCMQKLLNGGLLDWSVMSDTVRAALSKSLDDSRRLTMSLSQSMMSQDPNETQFEEWEEMLISPLISLPPVRLSLNDLELEIGSSTEAHERAQHCQSLLAELDSRNALRGQVKSLKTDLTEGQKARDVLEKKVTAMTFQIAQLEEQVTNSDQVTALKTKLAERNNAIDELRVKHGQVKESLKECQKQCQELKCHKDVVGMKNELSRAHMKIDELVSHQTKLESMTKDYESKLAELKGKWKSACEEAASAKSQLEDVAMQNNKENDDIEDLKRQLAVANEKLKKHRENKEKMDKVLRNQLAKTHAVLKQTKKNLDAVEN